MSWREFQTWEVYNSLYPLGERRADLRAGVIASMIANVHRDSDMPAYPPTYFMPDFDIADEEPLDEDESIALTQSVFESLTAQLGGIVQ